MSNQNIPFRRKLKQILKNAQRIRRSEEDRQAFLWNQLVPLGLWVNDFFELSMFLFNLPHVRGKTIRRIANAAKKQGKVVSLWNMAWSLSKGPLRLYKGPHEVPFFRPCIFKTPTELIVWKVWSGKPIERKIGA